MNEVAGDEDDDELKREGRVGGVVGGGVRNWRRRHHREGVATEESQGEAKEDPT